MIVLHGGLFEKYRMSYFAIVSLQLTANIDSERLLWGAGNQPKTWLWGCQKFMSNIHSASFSEVLLVNDALGTFWVEFLRYLHHVFLSLWNSSACFRIRLFIFWKKAEKEMTFLSIFYSGKQQVQLHTSSSSANNCVTSQYFWLSNHHGSAS